jgi:hypothetical protein
METEVKGCHPVRMAVRSPEWTIEKPGLGIVFGWLLGKRWVL